jgi:ferredoxin-NADP reductase
MPALYNWKLHRVNKETFDSVTIVFDTGADRFEYKPGQFINLTLIINDKPVTRSYSLSSFPDEDVAPAITVKRVTDGLMSEHILNHAEKITNWQIEGPHGFFYPNERCLQANTIVLIGGGSGITPLYSMLRYFLKYTSLSVVLINSNKTREDIIFSKSLVNLEQQYPERFTAWYILSRETKVQKNSHNNYLSGRLSKLILKKLIKKLIPQSLEESFVFICGPSGLIDLTEQAIFDLNISSEHIYKEYFLPPDETANEVTFPDSTQEVLLHLYEQTNLLEVEAGKTILEAALQDRIPINYSCKNGTCGTCVGKLTSGKVHMAKNFALRKEHLEQGFILLCQSHPLDNKVTIQIESYS